jgi:hypothetical protein
VKRISRANAFNLMVLGCGCSYSTALCLFYFIFWLLLLLLFCQYYIFTWLIERLESYPVVLPFVLTNLLMQYNTLITLKTDIVSAPVTITNI